MRTTFLIFIFVSTFLPSLLAHGEISSKPIQLTEQEKLMVEWIQSQQSTLLADLHTYVTINTGTFNHAGLNHLRNLLETELQSLGFATESRPGGEIEMLSCTKNTMRFAPHLLARRTGVQPTNILLNGHLDTVFPKHDDFQSMIIEEDGTLKGPGVLDMKGGIIVMTYALKALHQFGLLQAATITIFLNTDEEIGSFGSRPILEELAQHHDLGLIFEGSKDHKLVRQRKGLGQGRIKVTGREAHAGAAHAEGVSAILELAHKVVALEALTNYDALRTVNVGTMQGGEKRNTRPGCAEAAVDLRFADTRDGRSLESQVRHIALTQYTHHPSLSDFPKSEVWTVLHRPVKGIHPITDQLIAEAMGLSAHLGEKIVGTYLSGGGTDGSLTQAQGLPTLDSLGLNGGGAHSSREWTTVASLMARTKLAAVLLNRLIDGTINTATKK